MILHCRHPTVLRQCDCFRPKSENLTMFASAVIWQICKTRASKRLRALRRKRPRLMCRHECPLLSICSSSAGGQLRTQLPRAWSSRTLTQHRHISRVKAPTLLLRDAPTRSYQYKRYSKRPSNQPSRPTANDRTHDYRKPLRYELFTWRHWARATIAKPNVTSGGSCSEEGYPIRTMFPDQPSTFCSPDVETGPIIVR